MQHLNKGRPKEDLQGKERPEQQEQSAPAKEQHLKEFQAEFSVAEQSISEELKDIVYRSKDVNISMLLEPLNGLLKKADDDTDLADMLLHMKKQQSGLYAHTINVALFGQLLARWSGCTEAEIATITGHSLKTVGAMLDQHYLSRNSGLAESAIAKLEKHQARTGKEPL